MATIERFEDLDIWKLGSDLANEVFDLYTNSEKLSKDYGLKNQMNESSGSIMDNIAEGFERGSKNEFVNFLSYAKGSAGELKSQLYRAHYRKYLSKNELDEFCEKIEFLSRKIGKLIGYLNKCIYKGNKFKDRLQNNEGTRNPTTRNPKPETRNAKQ